MRNLNPTTEICCPSCGAKFRTEANLLDAVNFACGASTMFDPEFKIDGYGFCFRGYMASQSALDLVGVCLAARIGEDGKPVSPFFYWVVGSRQGGAYLPGTCFSLQEDRELLTVHGMADKGASYFVDKKKEAMDNLVAMVKERTA